MRELNEVEIKAVSGGNMFFASALSIAGAYYGGQMIGSQVYATITDSFSMSAGEAAYRAFNS
jgi:hypothetical protein